MWDSVPWMVGGGAEHSVEVARLLAFEAMNGNEGILHRGDLKVTAQSSPNGTVNVATGACAILCRAAAMSSQMYLGRMVSDDTVNIPGTTSAGARSDLIVARVEDPWLSGEPWSNPADATVGPYIFTRRIPNVPAGTQTVTELGLGYSAIPLARIDIPISTSNITAGMIHDLRGIANPRRFRVLNPINPSAINDIGVGATSYTDWMTVGGGIYVPAWAVQAHVRGDVCGGQLRTADAVGAFHVNLGGSITQDTVIDENYTGGNPHRFSYAAGGDIPIPSAIRATTQSLKIRAKHTGGTGVLRVDTSSTGFVDIEFVEVAE